jgi:hypothetical protein
MAQAQEVFLFQPTSVSGCQLWLDATDVNGNGTSVANGATISTWIDKSGNGRNATTFVNAPTFSDNAVRFATNQGLQTTLSASTNIESGFVISGFTNIGGSNTLLGSANGNGGRQFRIGPNVIQTIKQDVAGVLFTGANLSNNTKYLTEYVNSGSDITHFLNGNTYATGTSLAYDAGRTTSIGYRFGPFEPLNGYIQEIIVYSSALSNPQRQQIEGYLAWKWGLQGNLPETHPFKTYRPLANTPIPTQVPNMPLILQGTQPFIPTQISGCVSWFDAADSTTFVLSSSKVAQWNDKSGNGYSVVQTDSTKQPSLSSSPPGVILQGSAVLRQTIANVPLIANATALTMMFVGQQSGAGTNNFITMWFSTEGPSVSGGSPAKFYIQSSGSGGILMAWNGGSSLTSTNTNPTGQNAIFGAILASSGASTNINGTLTNTSSSALVTTGTTSLLTFGYSGYTNNIMNEIVMYNKALSTSERQQVEGYFAWKWGLQSSLPADHPYKTRQIAPFAYTTIPVPMSLAFWIPRRISSINAWFDGADPLGTGRAPGLNTSLGTWFDKSGNGRNASGGVSPTFVSGGVSFNGSSQFYTMSIPYSQNYSIFLVATNTSVAEAYFFARNALGLGREPTFIQGYIGAGIGLEWYEGADRGTIATTPSSPFMASVDHYQGVNIVGWYFGSESFNIPQTRAYNATAWDTLGQAGINVNYYGGIMKELIFYNTALTTRQRQQVEGYLAWKWGMVGSLPANHPYKRWPPSP